MDVWVKQAFDFQSHCCVQCETKSKLSVVSSDILYIQLQVTVNCNIKLSL